MPKFIGGVAFGVVMTIVAYSLLDTSSPKESVSQEERSESVGASNSAEVAGVERQRADSKPDAVREAVDSRRDESVPNQESTTYPAELNAATPAESASPESAPGPTNERDYSAYPPEIADILDTRDPKPLQTQYEAEEKEDSWATYMEGQLAAYFAQKPELAQFDISRIDCRTSVCEIQAIGYGTNARAAWTIATADIIQQPWHDFRRMSMSTRDPAPGIFAVVLVLAREAE